MSRRLQRFLSLVLALVPLSLHAFNVGPQRWSASPIVMHLQLGPLTGTLVDGSTSWGAVAEGALATWNDALVNMKFSVVRDSTVPLARSNRLNNVFFSPTIYGSAWDNRTLAITLSTFSGITNTFSETDVLFNTAIAWNSYRGPQRRSGGVTTYDLRRVALHEFGHALGLDHPDEIGQVVTAQMNSSVGDLDSLAPDDINGAKFIYDGGATVTAPAITAQPGGRSVAVGASTTFTVVATGTAPLAFQWLRNGTALPGATAASLTLNTVQFSDAASYAVVVSNVAGTVTSAAAVLTVTGVAVAPTITTQPASQTLTVGTAASFTVVAAGTSPLTYQWRRNGTAVAGATGATFSLPAAAFADAAAYTVLVTNSAGSVLSAAATLIVNPVGPSSRLAALSVRTTLAARQTVTVGFTMTGAQPKAVLVRAVGPGLARLGIADFMADPSLTLFDAASPPARLAANDDWFGAPAVAAAAAALGAFPLPSANSLDAALLREIVGGHTVQVTGSPQAANAAATAGTVVVEVYDAGPGNSPRLTGLSALNRVGTGANLLIAGFTLVGTGEKRVLIRGVGPTLGAPPFGLPDVLADPKLELFTAAAVPERIGLNDTYDASLAPVFASVGLFALVPGGKDAAFIVSLPPGGYTVQVSGADGGTGQAIVEVYELP